MAAAIPQAVIGYAAGKGREAGRDLGRARVPTGNRQYQGVILAEFLAAALIIAVAPLTTGRAHVNEQGDQTPYGPDEVKQLAAVGLTYFILALLSSGKHGRFAAWFGGLILLAIGLAQQQSGGLAGIFAMFKPSSQSATSGTAGVPGLVAPGAAAAIQNQAQNQFNQVPNATGGFPELQPGVPNQLVNPGAGAAIQGQVEQQFTQGGQTYSYTAGPGTVITTNPLTGGTNPVQVA